MIQEVQRLDADARPCPFCDSKNLSVFAELQTERVFSRYVCWVGCGGCGAQGPWCKGGADESSIPGAAAVAITLWNGIPPVLVKDMP